MKRYLFALIAALAMFQMAWADYSKDNLVVLTKEGASNFYSLTTRPVVKFNGGVMVLKSAGTEVKFALGDIQEIVFAKGTDTKKGDVNGDGSVDISDANILINIILGNDEAGKYDGRADVTGDGGVDVSDVNEIINLILNN